RLAALLGTPSLGPRLCPVTRRPSGHALLAHAPRRPYHREPEVSPRPNEAGGDGGFPGGPRGPRTARSYQRGPPLYRWRLCPAVSMRLHDRWLAIAGSAPGAGPSRLHVRKTIPRHRADLSLDPRRTDPCGDAPSPADTGRASDVEVCRRKAG